ncbi:hypothetical protein A171_04106 [Escherichia coli KTE213]|nr:hypothetical protein A171_04106 [Escherichia coli KTE213]
MHIVDYLEMTSAEGTGHINVTRTNSRIAVTINHQRHYKHIKKLEALYHFFII